MCHFDADRHPCLLSVSGGYPLTVNGNGFSEESVVKIDGRECGILSHSYGQLTCLVPQGVSYLNKTHNVTFDASVALNM